MTESLLFPIPAQKTLAVTGSRNRFPVNRIFCVGRNYAEHAAEMGHDPDKEAPFFFMKPQSSLTQDGSIPMPQGTSDLHHEVELVICLQGSVNTEMGNAELERKIYGHAVGVDLTKRDLQLAAKKAGRPWDMAKGFDLAAPIGLIKSWDGLPFNFDANISLNVNGTAKQKGQLGQMIWRQNEILRALAAQVTLQAGDLIFTGTPAGVGALKKGDTVKAQIQDLPDLEFTLV